MAADNVAITAGSGTSVAADDIGSVYYQRVKVTWGPDGTANDADVATGKPLPIQLRSSTGEDVVKHEDEGANSGDPGVVALLRRTDTPAAQSGTDGDYEPGQLKDGAQWVRGVADISVGSVQIQRPANTTAYAANDAWADTTPTSGGFSITGAAFASGGYGQLHELVLTSDADPATLLQGEIWIFNQSVTAVTDNAAFAITDAEARTLMGIVPFVMISSAGGSGANSVAYIPNIGMIYNCSGSTSLRFLVKVKNAYTPANGEILTVTWKLQRL